MIQGREIEQGGFFLFLGAVSLGLVLVVWPFVAPLLWAVLAAIMFQPLYRWFMMRLRGQNRAAIATLLVIFIAIIVPGFLIGSAVVDQAAGIVRAFQDGRIDMIAVLNQIHDALPRNMRNAIDNSGLTDAANWQVRVQDFLSESAGLIAGQALSIGGSVFGFVLAFGVGLYVTYFLLRDGRRIGIAVRRGLPLEHSVAQRLAERFVAIVRATVKGSMVVGVVQGALGALTFWIVGIPSALLFGVLMAIASFLPAVGPALVWVPMAIYLLAVGAVWQGLLVIVSGVAVIGLADNLLRPMLVGRDTGIPDWLVLVTTLGGIALLGLSGIVVGPLMAGLFLASWSILQEQRRATALAGGMDVSEEGA